MTTPQVTIKSGLRAAAERAAFALELHTSCLDNTARVEAYNVCPPLLLADYRTAVRDLAALLKAVEGNVDAFENATGAGK